MSNRKYFVFCSDNCKFEAMTKEQTLAAITQAVNEGTIGDIDTGFITTVKTVNGKPLRFFVGNQHEYESLSEDDKSGVFAIISNDTALEDITETLSQIEATLETMGSSFQEKHKSEAITITSGMWNGNTANVSILGITQTNTVMVAPHPNSQDDYAQYGVLCTAQGSGVLTFSAKVKPTKDLQVNVVVLD